MASTFRFSRRHARTSRPPIQPLKRIIALAGQCAELLERDSRIDARAIVDAITSGDYKLSPSDQTLAGDFGIDDTIAASA
jgi:hypothetical protein